MHTRATSLLKKLLESLLPENPTTATLYLLPKIHKQLENPPGRPIVSGNNSLCEPICRYVDHFLKLLVESLPSHVKDTTDILKRMDDVQLDNETLLVTCDVEALYTSIRHTDGLAATQFYLMMSDLDPELSQFLRIRRICSTDEHFEKQANDLSLRFRERGYQERDITRGYARAKDTSRGNLLTQSKRKKGNEQGTLSENT
ncbi:uncharacterized protein LOC130273474 isoform X2 [Hyla sarda]|uniref:uncharacterized protein LOC130273474 isoform X2 n=1 Tax=Hyla sarda TaxID=327740 RepID=UPI0024C46B81|nr:uncharacterized protein LOC130273474 isoform X2 [Hyla sarda]